MKHLYNVTVNIDESIVEEWLEWMIEVHIPDVMATKCFESYQIQKILTGEHQNGVSFSIMYTVPSYEVLHKYSKEYAPALQKEHKDRYDGKYAAFRTVMQIISQG